MDKFKEIFEKALKGGEGFSAAANTCVQSCMAQFDEACAGNQKFPYVVYPWTKNYAEAPKHVMNTLEWEKEHMEK